MTLTTLVGTSLTSSWSILNSAGRNGEVRWRKGRNSPWATQEGAWGHPCLTRARLGGEQDPSPLAAAQSLGAHAPGKHHLLAWIREAAGQLPAKSPSGVAAAPPPAEPTGPHQSPAGRIDMQEEEEEERFSDGEAAAVWTDPVPFDGDRRFALQWAGRQPSKWRVLSRDLPRWSQDRGTEHGTMFKRGQSTAPSGCRGDADGALSSSAKALGEKETPKYLDGGTEHWLTSHRGHKPD